MSLRDNPFLKQLELIIFSHDGRKLEYGDMMLDLIYRVKENDSFTEQELKDYEKFIDNFYIQDKDKNGPKVDFMYLIISLIECHMGKIDVIGFNMEARLYIDLKVRYCCHEEII